MKTASQLTISLLALSGLLFQMVSQAAPTSLSETPLKASVQAKPNVIFGLDDSGSMDSEVMLATNDGAFWWDYTNAKGWDAGGVLNYNSAGTAGIQFRKMVYLFPNGSGTGNRTYTDSSYDHFAVPPTQQFAWLRSKAFNPLYYESNDRVTYSPWSPAYGLGPYTNASITAAKSHPNIGTGTLSLSAVKALDTTSNWTFMALPGMKVPAGSKTCNPSSCTWADEPAERTVPASTVLRLAMDYYPATFWHPDPGCTSGANCAQAPDGTWLRRYEIKPGGSFPSGRSYEAEIQNFANWWQYARKRKLMLNSAMGRVLEDITGLNLGLVVFNGLANATMYDADSSDASKNARKVASLFYATNGSGGTPTRETLDYIGKQYKRTDMTSGKYNVIRYACQRNNAFIVTDGFANASTVSLPAYDSPYTETTYGNGAPYQTVWPGSLADIALRYYTNNPRADLPLGKLETTATDANKNLHMNTYGMTLGAKGTIFQNESTPVPTATGTWPQPNIDRHPSSVDDLWHATINGRGKMYTSSDIASTVTAIQNGLMDIKSQVGAQSAVAVSSVNLLAGDGQAYLATYNPAGWVGNLTANTVDAGNGIISGTANWNAGALLIARDWTTRKIFSTNGSSGIEFTSGNVGASINPDTSTFTNDGVVEYLRGNRTDEGNLYRKRASLIGAVLNVEPVVDSAAGVVYLASGEGMLHAFNTTDGVEQWAFVPGSLLNAGATGIGATVQRNYAFKTKLDATPSLGRYTDGGAKLLVGGMGAAGRSYYALDVSNPKPASQSAAAAQVKWTFPGPSQGAYVSKVEYTVGRPLVVKSADNGYVVLVTSGYDNAESIGDGKGRMWMLNANTGAVITEFTTTAGVAGSESGLAHIAGYREDDGTVRYVYGGDLLGKVWRFDLKNGTTSLIAELKDATNTPQPVTTVPQLTKINSKPVVIIGTGRLLDTTDFGNSAVQSIYAFTDDTPLSNVRSATTPLTLNANTVSGTVNWATSRGWHVDLPAGQQVNVDPKFVLGRLFVNTNVAGGSNCAQLSNGYVIDVKSGGGTYEELSTTANVASPLVVQAGDNKFFQENHFSDGTTGTKDKSTTATPKPRKNAWRAIMR